MAASPRKAPVSETDLLEPIRDVSHAVIQRLVPLVAASGLDKATFWPLHFLDRGNERHPGELARRMGVTPAACTSTVDQLVELGYVVRQRSEEDRRQVALAVTPKGRRTLDQVWRRFDATLEGVLAGIPREEIATTARTLRTIAARLRQEAPVPLGELRS
jgi:DNA-binding MarR family transcriptional regulator